MAENNALIVVDKLDPIEIFVKGGLDIVIETISKRAEEELKDATLETARGRKIYASVAYKIARSKTLLDDMGKELTIEQKRQIKKNDVNRNLLWERCEKLQSEKRKPLTDWEAAEDARIAKEKADAEFAQAWCDAHAEHTLWLKAKELDALKAEMARKEAEQKAKEEAERIAKEQKEAQEKAAKEAAERATREAEQAAEKARIEAAAKAQAIIDEAQRKEREASEAAAKAERDRIAAIEKAKSDQEAAVKAAEARAKEEADRKERERLSAEAKAKAEAERIASNRAHQAKINKEAMADFISIGFDDERSKAIVVAIASGKIRNVKIQY